MSFCSPRGKAFSHKIQDAVWVVLAIGIFGLLVFSLYQFATFEPVLP